MEDDGLEAESKNFRKTTAKSYWWNSDGYCSLEIANQNIYTCSSSSTCYVGKRLFNCRSVALHQYKTFLIRCSSYKTFRCTILKDGKRINCIFHDYISGQALSRAKQSSRKYVNLDNFACTSDLSITKCILLAISLNGIIRVRVSIEKRHDDYNDEKLAFHIMSGSNERCFTIRSLFNNLKWAKVDIFSVSVAAIVDTLTAQCSKKELNHQSHSPLKIRAMLFDLREAQPAKASLLDLLIGQLSDKKLSFIPRQAFVTSVTTRKPLYYGTSQIGHFYYQLEKEGICGSKIFLVVTQGQVAVVSLFCYSKTTSKTMMGISYSSHEGPEELERKKTIKKSRK
ncbi:hypothetical protein P5673_011880 [Acropora cervicornis]|uniref:Uncharacterized protein n=1 Tax=Acropora cervicornis TaxID=6130 RepID=A0AAD9QN97_ACRCE|nr:hypothetical protein P5673_011880 [Acropora cervicornis]